ncbi:hypothetical protein [Halobaculum sp. MBLA0143]|uniref:hypothetical protein n=1 Tax=Halobaculum sp. MBLA0143 TaxID=3079933 RepID=UPI003524B46D
MEYGVLDVYNHFVTGNSTPLSNPSTLLIGVGIIMAVVGVRRLSEAYGNVVDDLVELGRDDAAPDAGDELFTPIRTVRRWLWPGEDARGDGGEVPADARGTPTETGLFPTSVRSFRRRLGSPSRESCSDATSFVPLVPMWYKIAAYGFGLAVFYYNLIFYIRFGEIVTVEGSAVALTGTFLLFPLVYTPLIVDVAVLCLGISLFLPRRIVRADPSLFYHDPRNLGGLGSVGTVLRRSYLLYTVGLLAYVGVLYSRFLFTSIPTPYPPPGPLLTLLFSVLWGVGAAVVGYSVYRIHTFMKADKEHRLDELEAAARRRVESSGDTYTEPELSPEESATLQRRIDRVKNTRTYPFGAAASLRIGLGVLLPQALKLVLEELFP